MHTEDLLRVINEVDFVRDDIDEIKDHLQLNDAESERLSLAISSLDTARTILADLFPSIGSLSDEVRDELSAELGQMSE